MTSPCFVYKCDQFDLLSRGSPLAYFNPGDLALPCLNVHVCKVAAEVLKGKLMSCFIVCFIAVQGSRDCWELRVEGWPNEFKIGKRGESRASWRLSNPGWRAQPAGN